MVNTADEFVAGTPYLQNNTQANECEFLEGGFKFGLFVEKEPTTNNFVLSVSGTATHISGMIVKSGSIQLESEIVNPAMQHFLSQGSSIYVQVKGTGSVDAGTLIYIANDGTGKATSTAPGAGGVPVGMAKRASRECVIDCFGTKAKCVPINFGLGMGTVMPTPPLKQVVKEVKRV